MKAEPFVVWPETCPPALQVLGVSVTVLASTARTRGYELTLQAGDEGAGPPPHRHDWDESFPPGPPDVAKLTALLQDNGVTLMPPVAGRGKHNE